MTTTGSQDELEQALGQLAASKPRTIEGQTVRAFYVEDLKDYIRQRDAGHKQNLLEAVKCHREASKLSYGRQYECCLDDPDIEQAIQNEFKEVK